MKYLIIPDVHGRSYIKWYNKINEVDKVIFLGDYLDSFNIPAKTQLTQLNLIINLKEIHGDKITLLLGNHDLPYINVNKYGTCSGFQNDIYLTANQIFNDNLDKFDVVYEHQSKDNKKNWIFSHAGISKRLLNVINKYKENFKEESLTEFINNNWEKINELYYVSKHNGGINPYDGLFWIRPQLLLKNLPSEFNQVVGHTYSKFPYIWDTKESSLMCLDTGEGHIKIFT